MLSVFGHRAAIKRLATVAAALTILAGCTIIQGDTAALDKAAAKTPATTNPTAGQTTPIPASSDAAESIASAGIPIPLISPRHRDLRVASIDPKVGLSALPGGVSITALASVYLKFGNGLSVAENSRLNTPKEVRRVLQGLRYSQPDTMANGWYAVRAMAAAQDTLFAQGVREQVRIDGRDKVLASLDDPIYVLRIPGAGSATAAIIASATKENDRMIKLRQRFLATASEFQRQKWGMNAPSTTEAAIQSADASEANSTLSDAAKSSLKEFSPITEAHAYSSSVMTKLLGQGAREVISAPVSLVSPRSDVTSSCLNWARLNLNQCIAAAHFPSEEAWCAGKHAIEEVRTCWAAALPNPSSK